MNWIFQTGRPNSRAALADPALQQALVENGRRIREHADSLPVRPGNTPAAGRRPNTRPGSSRRCGAVPSRRSGRSRGCRSSTMSADYADVPVLHITGWYDSWTRQVTMNYEALSKAKKSPQRLVIGPWVHGGQGSNVAGEVEFTPDAGDRPAAPAGCAGTTAGCKGEKNGVDDDPPVLLYIMGTGDDRRSPAGRLQHGGSWRAEREWPLARARPTTLYLHGRRQPRRPRPRRGRSSTTTYTFDPRHPVPTDRRQHLVEPGPDDQRRLRPAAPRRHPRRRRTACRSPSAATCWSSARRRSTDDLEVTGTVEVKLWVASTARRHRLHRQADRRDPAQPRLSARASTSTSATRSSGPATAKASTTRHLRSSPGEPARVTITLYPTANVFKKGHRIRVDVSSSNYPAVRREPEHRRPAGRLPPDGHGRQHGLPRCVATRRRSVLPVVHRP